MSRKNFTIRYIIIFFTIITNGLLLVYLNVDAISETTYDKDKFISGNAIGIIIGEDEKLLGIIFGNSTINLSNQTQITNNSAMFVMSFEMIKTNEISNSNNTFTDIALMNISNKNNNKNIFTGIGIINISQGPVKGYLTIYLMKNNSDILYISMVNAPKTPKGPGGPPT